MKTYFIKVGKSYLKDFEMTEAYGRRAIQSDRYSESEFKPIFIKDKVGFDARTLKGIISTLIEWSRWNKCGDIKIEIKES